MNPSAVAVQGAFAAVGLALVAALGPSWAALPLACLTVVAWAILAAVGRRLRRKSLGASPGRQAVVMLTAVLLNVPWLIVWAASVKIGGIAPGDRSTTLAMVLSAATVMAVIYLSSLVDWFYVRPSLCTANPSRMLCRSSLDRRWKLVTRLWLVHRLVATLTFVVGVAIIVAVASAHWVFHNVSQVGAAGIAAAATVLAGFYLTRAAPVIAFAVTPALQIGDKVAIADEFTQTSPPTIYYVADVSLEGLSLLELDASDHIVRETEDRSHDRLLDIPDAGRLLRSRFRFSACGGSDDSCKRVNPYCPWVTQPRSDRD